MSEQGRNKVQGWGVFRSNPWHLVGIYDTEREALAVKAQAGPDYIVAVGQGSMETDEFIGSSRA